MPSKSKKQAKFMAAAAHNPKFARKAGIRQSIAKEFNRADTTGSGVLHKALGGAVTGSGIAPPPVRPPRGISGSRTGLSDVLRGTDAALQRSFDRLRSPLARYALGGRTARGAR